MISADAAFERVANAAAVAFAQAPPYIACRVDVNITAPSLPPFERHELTLRTADGRALVRTGDAPRATIGAPLPLSPAVDALAQWAFAFDLSGGHVRLNVAYEHPKHYAAPTPAPGDTVVVASVGGYAVRYAADGDAHLVLEPATREERAFAAQPDDFVYHDVWFDPVTYLPERVRLVAPGQTFELDYTVKDTYWLLESFTYDGTLAARTRPPQTPEQPEHIDAHYSAYRFPASVPELAGAVP